VHALAPRAIGSWITPSRELVEALRAAGARDPEPPLLPSFTALATDQWIWFPFWLGVGSLFVIDRVVSAWSGGWKARLLAVLLVPELLYDMYLDVVFVKGIFDITFARDASWGHVAHVTQPTFETVGTEQREAAEVTA